MGKPPVAFLLVLIVELYRITEEIQPSAGIFVSTLTIRPGEAGARGPSGGWASAVRRVEFYRAAPPARENVLYASDLILTKRMRQDFYVIAIDLHETILQ